MVEVCSAAYWGWQCFTSDECAGYLKKKHFCIHFQFSCRWVSSFIDYHKTHKTEMITHPFVMFTLAFNLSFQQHYGIILVKPILNSFAVSLGVFWLPAGGTERMWFHPPVPKQVDCLGTGQSMSALCRCVAWLGKLWALNGDGMGLLFLAACQLAHLFLSG